MKCELDMALYSQKVPYDGQILIRAQLLYKKLKAQDNNSEEYSKLK